MKSSRGAQLAVCMLIMAGAAHAQSFGIKAGLNMAKLKIDLGGISGSSETLYNFHGGVYGILMTSEKFGFQGELLYSAQGAEGSSGGGNINIGYVLVPIMMRYDLSVGVSAQAGPQIGFLMNATADGQDIKSDLNTVDFGLGFGLGVERPSGVMFSFRYVFGLTNVLTSAASSSGSGFGIPNITMTNQVIQFSIGYVFVRK